jgi:hypothetical protein
MSSPQFYDLSSPCMTRDQVENRQQGSAIVLALVLPGLSSA